MTAHGSLRALNYVELAAPQMLRSTFGGLFLGGEVSCFLESSLKEPGLSQFWLVYVCTHAERKRERERSVSDPHTTGLRCMIHPISCFAPGAASGRGSSEVGRDPGVDVSEISF